MNAEILIIYQMKSYISVVQLAQNMIIPFLSEPFPSLLSLVTGDSFLVLISGSDFCLDAIYLFFDYFLTRFRKIYPH